MSLAIKRWTGMVLRFARYALLAFVIVNIAVGVFRYAAGNKVEYLILNLGILVSYACAKLYLRIADGFLDRLSARLDWRPFTRDLVNLVCFGLIVSTPVLVAHNITQLLQQTAAPGM